MKKQKLKKVCVIININNINFYYFNIFQCVIIIINHHYYCVSVNCDVTEIHKLKLSHIIFLFVLLKSNTN